MLPIFRIISVGGVTLAIAIFFLALNPPGSTRLLGQHDVAARGPLLDAGQHPEWRQFLLQAALRRASELERLRELRDTILREPTVAMPEIVIETPAAPAAPQIAVLPATTADDRDTEDFTGSIGGSTSATIPIEIGAASSTELPVTAVEEVPPVIRLPALQLMSIEPAPLPPERPQATPRPVGEPTKKPDARKRTAQQRAKRKPQPSPQPQQIPPPFNILAAIFGGLSNAEAARQPTVPAGNSAAQRAGKPHAPATPR